MAVILCEERALNTHWAGGCVGFRTVLHAVVKRKIPTPAGSRILAIQLVASYVSD
jgi:hypothetical protein